MVTNTAAAAAAMIVGARYHVKSVVSRRRTCAPRL